MERMERARACNASYKSVRSGPSFVFHEVVPGHRTTLNNQPDLPIVNVVPTLGAFPRFLSLFRNVQVGEWEVKALRQELGQERRMTLAWPAPSFPVCLFSILFVCLASVKDRLALARHRATTPDLSRLSLTFSFLLSLVHPSSLFSIFPFFSCPSILATFLYSFDFPVCDFSLLFFPSSWYLGLFDTQLSLLQNSRLRLLFRVLFQIRFLIFPLLVRPIRPLNIVAGRINLLFAPNLFHSCSWTLI